MRIWLNWPRTGSVMTRETTGFPDMERLIQANTSVPYADWSVSGVTNWSGSQQVTD